MKGKKLTALIAIQSINIITCLGAFKIFPIIGESFIYISAIMGFTMVCSWKGTPVRYKRIMQVVMGVLFVAGIVLSVHNVDAIIPGAVAVICSMFLTAVAIVSSMPQNVTPS